MNETERLLRIIELLLDQCRQGLVHHRVWYRMVNEVQRSPSSVLLPDTKSFLSVTARAHLYHAVTFVNRVYDRTEGAVSINYLLTYVNSNARKIEGATVDDLNAAVRRDCKLPRFLAHP